MTQELEIDPQTATPIPDIRADLDKIHICLQQLKDGLLPPGGDPWPVPKPPYGNDPYGYGGFDPNVPDDKPLPPGEITPVGLVGDTVLKPKVVSPVTLNVNQVLPISFQLFEQYPFDVRSVYAFTKVVVAVDTTPFGGAANIGFPGAGAALARTGFTDTNGLVRFNVIGLRAGAASLIATALGETVTVDFTVT